MPAARVLSRGRCLVRVFVGAALFTLLCGMYPIINRVGLMVLLWIICFNVLLLYWQARFIDPYMVLILGIVVAFAVIMGSVIGCVLSYGIYKCCEEKTHYE